MYNVLAFSGQTEKTAHTIFTLKKIIVNIAKFCKDFSQDLSNLGAFFYPNNFVATSNKQNTKSIP